jgi:hypothetical protein
MRLAPGLSGLSDDQLGMTARLIEAAQAMDAIFWEQAYGNRDSLLQALPDAQQRRAVQQNYGPWARLRGNAPFLDGVGPRPPGAGFYPAGFTADSVAQLDADTLRAPHTVVRRLPNGSLTALPYHLFFAESLTSAAFQLRDAAALADNEAVRVYLTRRADALLDGRYGPSERAWHALSGPPVDVLIGPMNTGEDRLLGVKESMAGLVMHRNVDRSRALEQRLDALPARLAATGLDSLARPQRVATQTWGAYDALYATGAANTGPKATVWPRPLTAGPRRLLLANVIRARATKLLRPTAQTALDAPSRARVTPRALFAHTALRVWAQALLATAPSPEAAAPSRQHATATALALALAPTDTSDGRVGAPAHYATAVADLLHTVRVDSTSREGRAARLLLGALQSTGALTTAEPSVYTVVPDTMAQTLPALVRDLRAGRLPVSPDARTASPLPGLRTILAQLDDTGVPRGLAFEQGPAVLRPLQAAAAVR